MTTADGATTDPRIRINRPDDENARCKVSRAWEPRKDFSQCMQQLTTSSTSSAISPQQERTEPSGRRPCRRGVKSSLRREPDVQGDLLRALFGNVTEPFYRQRSLPLEFGRRGLARRSPSLVPRRAWRRGGNGLALARPHLGPRRPCGSLPKLNFAAGAISSSQKPPRINSILPLGYACVFLPWRSMFYNRRGS